jgi:hypothetical protein
MAVRLPLSAATALADVVSLGNQSCETWTAHNQMQGGLGLLYQQWAFGFLSAVSYDGPATTH